MTRKAGGIGPKPGKKRNKAKCEGLNTEGTAAHDAAAVRWDAKALLSLSSKSPAAAAAPKHLSPATKAAASKYHRDKVARLEAECEHLNELRTAANGRARLAEEREQRWKEAAAKRLTERDAARESERAWREDLHDAEDERDEREGEETVASLRKLGQEKRGHGGGKGQKRWPQWILQLILEKLVLGISPTVIPDDIISQDRLTTGREDQEVPSVTFCRDMRIVLRIMTETLAAYQLGKVEEWWQLFTDGTGRRQIALETIVIGLEDEDNGRLKSLILSSACVLEGETSEQTADAVLRQIKSGGDRLARWIEVHERDYPEVEHDIPDASEMDVGKLGGNGGASTDTAPAARKQRRLLCEAALTAAAKRHGIEPGADDQRLVVLEIDCWNHLRNVWVGGMMTKLTARLKMNLQGSLEAIDNRLRVSTSMESALRAMDKEFSLCANYPKGHGELFLPWMQKNHPGAILFHVERAGASRQDFAVEGSAAFYMNRVYYIEFIDERLRTCGADGNILQENLFIVMTSLEMIAQARVCSIIHIAVCLPARWLAGNTHNLAEYDWSVRSMGRVASLLETALESIEADGYLLLDDDFMFGIFEELIRELPPLEEYLDYMYEEKALKSQLFEERAAGGEGSSTDKVLPLTALRDELFRPESETNQDTEDLAVEMAVEAATALLAELRDETKATSEYLCSKQGRFCWELTTEEDHEQGKGLAAVNDPAESSFAGLTRQLQCFGRLALSKAGAVSQSHRNADLKRQRTSADGKDGILHRLKEEMRASLFTMCMEDLGKTRTADNAAIKAQREAKRRKEELAREASMAKGQEAFIDALYYREMYDSPACWKTAAAVDRELAKLKSKTAKLEHLKENIRMRVVGLGWTDLETAWSKDGKEFSPEHLASHLKTIIVAARLREIPDKPPLPLAARKELPTLGTQLRDAAALDLLHISKGADFEAEARRVRAEREAAGIGDSAAERQQTTAPLVDKALLRRRLEYCFSYDLDDGSGSETRWEAGEVVLISDGTNCPIYGRPRAKYKAGEAVMIRWDDAWDPVDENDKRTEEERRLSAVALLKSKWNPKGEQMDGGWRFDPDHL